MPAGQLAALAAQPPPDGPGRAPALLVPGYTGSKEDFLSLLPLLAAGGHRTVAIDQRGQYESPGPDNLAAYGVQALATDLLHALDVVGAPGVHVVGHSFGGLVARAAVIRRPERFASLTLLCSGPAAISGLRAQRIRTLEPLLRRGGLAGVLPAMELEWRAARQAGTPSAVVEFLRTRFLTSSAAGLEGMGTALLTEPDRVAELAATGVPVLVAYGEDDDAWPPTVQAQMAARLGAPVEVIAGAAHSPAAEAPAVIAAALLRFFSAVGDGHR